VTNFISANDKCLKQTDCQEPSCSAIEKVIDAREKDLGGFSVRRVLPFAKQKMVGPWIFFDHMGPADFPPAEGINVRPHPHINLATVTYTFEGEIWHRDSLGNSEAIQPGDINLMVAGKGITHSERTAAEKLKTGQKLNGLQLWLALPEQQEEVEPAFYHYDANDIPQVDVEGVPVRVMIGEAYGITSPVKQFADTLYVEARLSKDQKLILPQAEERAIYVVKGQLEIAGQMIQAYQMAILSTDQNIEIQATKDSFITVMGGEKLGTRHIYWNFVSSQEARIEEAKEKWRNGEFAKVPGDEKEFIPLPEDSI
tara:strand:+ start:81 stop:1016 length:936 start_codon:yes stop_codon:yes gene_type:complete